MTAEEFTHRLFPVKEKLFRFAYRLLGNKDDALDAVQDVYLKMWQIRSQLIEIKSIEAMMMTSTRNLCLDRLKRKSNKFETLDENYSKRNPDNQQPNLEHADLLHWVKKEMELLPEQQKSLLFLRDMEQLDFEEIAEIIGFDLNYIRVNLSRARKRIRERIQEMTEFEMSRNPGG